MPFINIFCSGDLNAAVRSCASENVTEELVTETKYCQGKDDIILIPATGGRTICPTVKQNDVKLNDKINRYPRIPSIIYIR